MQAPALRAADGPRPDKVSFYFAAHEDDWQLFMNPSAFQDVIDGAAKTVFVHMTAGDAGLGIGWGGRKHQFYLARENGAEAAIHFMADADGIPTDEVAEHRTFNGHSIYRLSYRNTVSYFLRVPDGNNLTGDGYYDTGFQSLKRLADGKIDELSAVDGSTVYRGWSDLTATLRRSSISSAAALSRSAQRRRDRRAHQPGRPSRSLDDGESRARRGQRPRLRAARLLR